MNKNELDSVLDRNFPDIGEITAEVVKYTQANSSRFRGSVRLSTGRIVTREDLARREKIRNTPLP